ncbi:DUF4394 domain-containing protein [Rhodocytophaga aerolata]|uniref:DUF4394 domain-containing protein n=1 Tax=Rhodocytophaga aerolata TaxID=455078 RepID=A0ABT8RD67_9BACT|nr:DUF4394 domain-containing protein [Rhodocytophaga aerolata]MDO1450037.1 DUF4394 domain-containing protein [Rhodocytophaga aerolata]
MKKLFKLHKGLAVTMLMLALAACQKDDLLNFPFPGTGNNPDKLSITFYALASGVSLDKISTDNPEKVLNSATITGLQAGEKILAIDFRPATGQLYGLSSTSRLYVINPETGSARMIGSDPFSPMLEGNIAGFDFNPTVDRIRVVTSSGQNLRLNPETGAVAAVDGPINGQAGAQLAASAYDNTIAGATSTTLYNLDLSTQKLFKQIPPNDGTLVEVGSLGLKIEGEGGFDIAAKDGTALGLFEVNKKAILFTVDLTNGKAKKITSFTKDDMYTGIAIPTEPVAYAVDATNHLLVFNPNNTAATVSKPISGMTPGDKIAGIDFRPLNGQLFALGTSGTIYTLNTSSGAAAINGTLSVPLQGTHFGFDFNPTVDRIRIISNTGQNLRYNPNDGSVLVDGMLNPGTPAVTASAYTNNFAGATATMLFNIDTNTDKLYLQNPPNNGTLVEVGALGVNVEAANGFDISGTKGIGYALLSSGSNTKLYTIDTATGSAKEVGNFSYSVQGFAIGLGF